MTGERPILIVDDDAVLRTMLTEQFAVDGEFIATGAESASEAETRIGARNARFDALILDVTLPDGDGRDLCARLRRSGIEVPIIMLTGSDEEGDVVRGLDRGPTTTSPSRSAWPSCSPACAPSCASSRTARTRSSPSAPYTFRPAAKLLQDPAKNHRIRLTEKEAAILKYLYRAGSRPVARQILLNEVWGYNSAVTTHTLETHIYRLRQKIEPDPSNARLLITEGGGYRLDPAGAKPLVE